MSPHEFLADARTRWRGLPESSLLKCSDEERVIVRSLEAQASQLEFAALTDLVLNCHNRFQFAKSYKLLWEDLRKTLSQPGNPNAATHVNQAVKEAMEQAVRQKLTGMAGWFELHFADGHDRRQVESGRVQWSIENYAGKEGTGTAGCASAILLAVIAGIGAVGVVLFA